MTEFQIYSAVYGVLLLFFVSLMIPRGIIHFRRLVREAQAGEVIEPSEEAGVPTQFVNIVDILVVLILFGLFGLGLWETRPLEGETTAAEGVIDAQVLVYSLLGQLISVVVVCLIIFWRTRLPEQFGLSLRGRWRSLLWSPLILIACWVVTGIIIQAGYFTYLEETFGESPLQEAVILLQESTDPVLLGLMALVACIGAPVAEEVLFRGYLYPVSKAYAGRAAGIIFSGALFGLIHFNLAGMPTLILMGCLLAWAYERTKTLWVPILAHCLFNSVTTGVQLLSRFEGYEWINPDF